MNITILGTGAYGLALSKIFLDNNCNIMMWTKFEDERDMLIEKRCNKKLLPEYIIDNKIKITSNLEEAINNANVIVIAIPVKFISDTIKEVSKFYNKKQHICIASKGIEQDSCLFVANIIKKYINTKKICAISGGTFAVDIIKNVPIGLTLATKNKSSMIILTKCFKNKLVKLDYSSDIFGIEMYGAIKNILAIASGIIDGLNYPESTKCMFITISLNNIMNLIYELGGNKKSLLTFAGLGDLLLTCNSSKSRNYTLGFMIGTGDDKEKIDDYINNTTIEGLYTLKSIYDMLNKKNKNIKIIKVLYDILYKNADKKILIDYLTN